MSTFRSYVLHIFPQTSTKNTILQLHSCEISLNSEIEKTPVDWLHSG